MQAATLPVRTSRGSLHFWRSVQASRWRGIEALRASVRGEEALQSQRTYTMSVPRQDAKSPVEQLSDPGYIARQHLGQRENVENHNGVEEEGLIENMAEAPRSEHEDSQRQELEDVGEKLNDEAFVLHARRTHGDTLPEGLLSAEQLKIWTRLYDAPDIIGQNTYEVEEQESSDDFDGDTVTNIMREAEDGILEEIEYLPESDVEGSEEIMDIEAMLDSREFRKLKNSKKGKFFAKATKKELDQKVLFREMTMPELKALSHLDAEWKAMDEDARAMYLNDARYLKLEHYFREGDRIEDADELLQCLYIHLEAQAELNLDTKVEAGQSPDHELDFVEGEEVTDEVDDRDGDELLPDGVERRYHRLTLHNRFGTSPSTIYLPQEELVKPTAAIISGSPAVHLKEAARKLFGGSGLPYSTSNPAFAKSLPQKHIPIDPSQERMSDMEADAYFSAVTPGSYASIMSVLVETRKRLGGQWLEGLLQKEGGPRILDASSAGAGVIAFRELLRAEWERLKDDSFDPDASKAVANPNGREGGQPAKAPMGRATVLTTSAVMRRRASALLEDTTFVPRLPDYVHATNASAAQQGKFDIIIASHALWPMKEDYMRKQYVANMWSLLNSKGGVLVLIEKGVPRGFEVIGGARKFLLDKRISSPGQEMVSQTVSEPSDPETYGVRSKERGMIIAPCTNHTTCPMYTRTGVSIGRHDFCHFKQRYIRPPYLQKLLEARDKNHEDVSFSYLSVMRGHDLRDPHTSLGILQGPQATDAAFAGYEHDAAAPRVFDPTAPAIQDPDTQFTQPVNSLSLPRAILPPLKRTGHVIMDLCTPSGTYERWIISRSQSRQAFHDARKSSWGDIWALGAKTRIPRVARLGKANSMSNNTGAGSKRGSVTKAAAGAAGIDLKKVTVNKKARKTLEEQADSQAGRGRMRKEVWAMPVSEMGVGEEFEVRKGGRMRGPRVSGVRDKRPRAGGRRIKVHREED